MAEAEPPLGQTGAPAFVPVADVYELEGALVIRLAVPGALEEDIDISFGPGGVTVRGETEAPAASDEGRALVREWRYGYFERVFELPSGCGPEGLRVSVESGVLEIRLKRQPE
jgi:HSP20 family molecular chaperone IbpA